MSTVMVCNKDWALELFFNAAWSEDRTTSFQTKDDFVAPKQRTGGEKKHIAIAIDAFLMCIVRFQEVHELHK